MTVLTIGHLGAAGPWRIVIDKVLAIDALVFLISAMLSFISMRVSKAGGTYESSAEVVFVIGLGVLALGAMGLAFAIN